MGVTTGIRVYVLRRTPALPFSISAYKKTYIFRPFGGVDSVARTLAYVYTRRLMGFLFHQDYSISFIIQITAGEDMASGSVPWATCSIVF